MRCRERARLRRHSARLRPPVSYEGRTSPERCAALRKLDTDWRKPHIEEAPHLIVVFEQVYGLAAYGGKQKHYYVRESVGIAVGFLLAALHAAGLATLTHTPSPMGSSNSCSPARRTSAPLSCSPWATRRTGAWCPGWTASRRTRS